MCNQRPTDFYELLAYVLDQFKGTPQEFGELVYDANMTIHHWLDPKAREDRRMIKALARAQIVALDGGAEYLQMERDGVV